MLDAEKWEYITSPTVEISNSLMGQFVDTLRAIRKEFPDAPYPEVTMDDTFPPYYLRWDTRIGKSFRVTLVGDSLEWMYDEHPLDECTWRWGSFLDSTAFQYLGKVIAQLAKERESEDGWDHLLEKLQKGGVRSRNLHNVLEQLRRSEVPCPESTSLTTVKWGKESHWFSLHVGAAESFSWSFTSAKATASGAFTTLSVPKHVLHMLKELHEGD